ncbi:hypothetical protein EMCG_08155 [[Emmonsia] crescens]|uniref:Uncharacterized protein n=1 Tax=[Emmonsia] crescens TaxID=73230 RepID=A0A0G2I769_9EURO|nr:hypothetical protein EMCG_08155 [Emmonsia crescens UAMH 3008]
MVFSPCPRSQSSKGSTRNARGTPLPNDLAHQDLPARPSSAVVGNLSEERLAFEAIFRPSTPRTGDPEPEILPEVQDYPRTAANQTKQIHPKASRISLIQLSHKIRRRLSRESQLSKKSSKKFKERGATLQDGDQNANPTTGVDITTTIDAEYDSDARYILTPQIIERITGGIIGIPGNPRRVLSKVESAQGSSGINHDMFPTGFDGTASAIWDEAPSLEKMGPSNLESILANSRGFDKLDRFDSGFKPRLQLVSRRFTPISIPGSSNSPADRGKPPGGKDIDNPPRFESLLSKFSFESDLARTNDRRALVQTPPIPYQAKIRSDIGKSRSDGPTPKFELELAPLNVDYDGAGPNRKAAASSKSFVLLDSKQTRSRRTSSADGQNPSARQRSNKFHAQSRFIESFDDVHVYSSSASDPVIGDSDSGQKYTGTRSVSDGWLSDGKRQGYGYHFVMEEAEKSPDSELHVIKPQTDRKSTTDTELLNLANLSGSKRSLKYASMDSSESTTVSQQAHAGEELGDKGDKGVHSCGDIVSQMNSIKSQKNPYDSVEGNKNLFSSWTRFPSHSKAGRNESAGLSDSVVARDFVAMETCKASQNINDIPLPQATNEQTDPWPSIKKGTGLFNWVRLHRSDDVDRRRYRAGHRRETSRSDELKDPDLEIIPGGPTGQLILEQIGDIGGETKRQKPRVKARESSERVSEHPTPWRMVKHSSPLESHPQGQLDFSTFDGSGMDAPMEPCSADVWSRLYEDCIGSFSDDGGVVFDPGSVDGLEKTPIDRQRPDPVSTSMDLRTSTTEFKEEQLVNEVGSKDRLLRLVEQTWGRQ